MRPLLEIHNGYRDSRFMRFYYRVTGNTDKFNMKVTKAEEKYAEVAAQLKDKEDSLSEAQSNVERDTTMLPELQNAATLYSNTAKELGSLLDSIFCRVYYWI